MKQIELGLEVEAEHKRHRRVLETDDPWFGRFRVETGEGPVTVRVGPGDAPEHQIVDWRHPDSAALFDAHVGQEVELVGRGRAVRGRLEERAKMGAEGRRVRQVELFGPDAPTPSAPGPAPRTPSGLPNVLSLLTPAQYRLITATRDRPVVLQGRAGSGKTTVALHRVSWLSYPGPEGPAPLDPSRVLVVMFNRALRAYVASLMAPLGLSEARIDTFHGWALEAIKSASSRPVEVWNQGHEGREAAVRVKRNVGMLSAVSAFVERQKQRLRTWLEEHLREYGAMERLEAFDAAIGPVVPRLQSVLVETRQQRDRALGSDQQRLEQAVRIFERAIFRMTQFLDEVPTLLEDRSLLREHLERVPPWDVDSCARLQARIHAADALSFDDFALVLLLMLEKTGGLFDVKSGEISLFEHIVIDEAQDFGPVELDVLLRLVPSPADVTIVGDLNQKIVPDADFVGWTEIARRLGVDQAAVAHLEVGHRSTRPIMALAHGLMGLPAPDGREGRRPEFVRVDDEDQLLEALLGWARRRWAESANPHLCVVCGHRDQAKALAERLGGALTSERLPVRWGHNRSFEFAPGLTVTNARQLKGLEFDGVAVVEPSDQAYPETEDGRRLLYTVITRAQDDLLMLGVAAPGGLIRDQIDAGHLLERSGAHVDPVVFRAEDEEPF
ncbi:MAG: UvrD-helicase domain-containing protein [Myxococcota bacterium]